MNPKVPYHVNFDKVPWRLVEPATDDCHRVLAPHYHQILSLALRTIIPGINQDKHLRVSEAEALRVLPNSIYFLPIRAAELETPSSQDSLKANKKKKKLQQTQLGTLPSELALPNAANADAPLWVPPGWSAKVATDPLVLSHYSRINADLLPVRGIWQLASPDLRLVANVLRLGQPEGWKATSTRTSAIRGSSIGSALNLPAVGSDGAHPGFSMFHIFRPNRAPSELVKPLHRFYQHGPSTFAGGPSPLEEFLDVTSWTPMLQAPQHTTIATPMPKYSPPKTYLYGPPGRYAIKPGDTFGSRNLQWGFHW